MPEDITNARVCFFGAAGDTMNLGVSALQHATLEGLLGHLPGVRMTVFDHGKGSRRAAIDTHELPLGYELLGAWSSRRIYRPESWWNIRSAMAFGGTWNRAARTIMRSDAVLDISGGDSFSDLYGAKRFRSVAAPKEAALAAGTPLILLPQTYGPFRQATMRDAAKALVRGADMAWARDHESYLRLQELLGEEFDSRRHLEGVDVAFDLRPVHEPHRWPARLRDWLQEERPRPVMGLNVSGLVYFATDPRRQFGLELDYRSLTERLVARVLAETDARILLVAHVLGTGGYESDENANHALLERFSDHRERIMLAPTAVTPGEIKAVIGALDWFCGTRMHSCIAALSSHVPAASVAYSPKTRGVFESVHQGDQVVEGTATSTGDALELLWKSWEQREQTRSDLARAVPDARRRASQQMTAVAGRLAQLAATRKGP